MARVEIPDERLPARLNLDSDSPMSDDEYYDFCVANPDTRLERAAEGEIIIVPPVGAESDYRTVKVVGQLGEWADRDGRGRAFGPSAEFLLPTPVCPELVVEVMSPSDRLRKAKQKMEEWIRAGVELGWLIDSDHQTVYIYRSGQSVPEERKEIASIAGEGPIGGFELDLTKIWAGL